MSLKSNNFSDEEGEAILSVAMNCRELRCLDISGNKRFAKKTIDSIEPFLLALEGGATAIKNVIQDEQLSAMR